MSRKNKNTIFTLTQYYYYGRATYPRKKLDHVLIGYFSTLAIAEEALVKWAKDELESNEGWKGKECKTTQCYVIEEEILDEYTNNSVRCYNGFGEFYEGSLCPQLGPFMGREADSLRFKVGDIVQVFYRDYLEIGIVAGTPYTPNQAKHRFELSDKCREENGYPKGLPYTLDQMDDSYTILHFGGLEEYINDMNPNSWYVFPITKHLPKKIIDELQGLLERWER